MWTGVSALSNIDQSLQTIRNEVVRLDTELSQLTLSAAANQRQRLKLINDIARVRLVELESGKLHKSLSAADHEAVDILEQRESAMDSLNRQIELTNQQLAELETDREVLLQSVNKISQKIVDTESLVQTRLKADASYLAQFEKARQTDSVAQEAHHKVEMAQADMADKAKPYQADTLFMYLWERGYGTTEYDGGLIARFLDAWVARLIKYEPARVNYWNLTEIPKRLAEHADSVRNVADEENMALQQIELDALAEAGAKVAEQELLQGRQQLDAKDDDLEAVENQLNQLLENRARYVSGQDQYMLRCVERLSQALHHQDLYSIQRYVRDTLSPTDDLMVVELRSIDDKLADVAEDLRDARSLHDAKLTKLKDLEQVRRKFKNSRYDDVRSGFGNQSLLVNVLAQFLSGAVSGTDLWRVFERNQRYRDVGSMPDFGSGGLGSIGEILGGGQVGRSRSSRPTNSTWHWPKPRRGGGGFKLPRSSGRRGGGGFKTGGGF